uniref:Uncharacterized protein n=1 Tax=Globodera rostochiensis TaxID=31243 RepID=A0A914HME4_GLORO
MSTIPIDEILGAKENIEDGGSSAKMAKPRGLAKPKSSPATFAELQSELQKTREEILTALQKEVGEALGKFARELEGVQVAVLRMAKVMDEMAILIDEKKVQGEFEEMSLEDEGPEEGTQNDGGNEEVQAPVAPDEAVPPLRGGRGHYGYRGSARGLRGNGHRGGRGGTQGFLHAHHHYHMRKNGHFHHHQGAAGSSYCHCNECMPTRRFGPRRFRPYGQGPR